MRVLNDLVAFAIELLALVLLAWWGLAVGEGLVGVILAVVAVGLFIAVWARWLAPRAKNRLSATALVPAKLGMFAAPVLALGALGHLEAATALAAAAVIHVALAHHWGRI